jgi:hypothetical protein
MLTRAPKKFLGLKDLKYFASNVKMILQKKKLRKINFGFKIEALKPYG